MSDQKLGASGKMLEINLATTVPPFNFETAFRAAYTGTGVRRFISRSVIVVEGAGTLSLKDCEGDTVTVTLATKELREFEAVGVVSASGISRICVML